MVRPFPGFVEWTMHYHHVSRGKVANEQFRKTFDKKPDDTPYFPVKRSVFVKYDFLDDDTSITNVKSSGGASRGVYAFDLHHWRLDRIEGQEPY